MRVKSLLDDLGFVNVWNQFDKNVNYLPLFKHQLRDQFIQIWNTCILLRNLISIENLKQYLVMKNTLMLVKT